MKRRGIKTNIWSSLAGLELYTIPSLLFSSYLPHFVILIPSYFLAIIATINFYLDLLKIY